MKKILLLNPPSMQPVFRDCYCSCPSKGAFDIHPLDLLIQSGYFSTPDYNVFFVDAMIEKLTFSQTLARIKSLSPDIILSLTGAIVLEWDCLFFNQLKSALPTARLFVSGDIARFEPQIFLQRQPEIEGILLYFGSNGLLEYIEKGSSPYVFTSEQSFSSTVPIQSFQYPLPNIDIARQYSYKLPFFYKPSYYSICTSFGCPYTCRYCNTHLLGYARRPVDDIIEELHWAFKSGYTSLYIRDATFMVDKARTLNLFQKWRHSKLNFQWICFTRADLLDEELVENASQLGCCLMMVGVESYNEAWLHRMSRFMKIQDIFRAFELLRKYKIPSAAQIMPGAGNDLVNRKSYEKRLYHFIRCLDPDYISLNIFSKRPGLKTDDAGLLNLASHSQSYHAIASRINRKFYFHPRRIIRHLQKIVKWLKWGRTKDIFLTIFS